MAPNRKQLNLLATSLADLELVQPQAKYLPLTHPSEQAQETVQTPKIQSSEAPASYWDWEANVPEEPKDLFSAAAIEANLIKDSQRAPSANVIRASDVSENDCYWDETVEEVSTTTKPQHDTYWSWPAQAQSALIQAILEEEAASQKLSTAKLLKNLLNSRSAAAKSQPNPASDNYWEWPSQATNEDLDEAYSRAYWEWESDLPSSTPSNSEVIAALLQQEACRQILSLERMEKNLKEFRASGDATQASSSDSYWAWPTVEDNYWDMNAQPAVAAAGQGYWDW